MAAWSAHEPTGHNWARHVQSMGARQVLAGSSFHLSSAGGRGDPGLTVWSRGSFSRFDGLEDDSALGGNVASATLGADYAADRALVGAVLSYSDGNGTVSEDGTEHDVSTNLAGVYPYVLVGVSDHFSIWGTAGRGSGSLELTMKDAQAIRTKVAMSMAAAGTHTDILSASRVGHLSLALKSDALLLRIKSSEAPDLAAIRAESTRVRLLFEGSREFALDATTRVSPFVEAGLRHDGGGGSSGFGVEIGSGVRYARPELGLTAELRARGLIAHTIDGYRELGASGSLRYDPHPGSDRGASIRISSSWGPMSASGLDTLWRHEVLADSLSERGTASERTIEAEIGYGFPVRGGIGTPWTGLSLSDHWRKLRIGYRLRLGTNVTVGVDGTIRQDATGKDSPNYAVMGRVAIR